MGPSASPATAAVTSGPPSRCDHEKHGLYFEALPLPIFVIGGDPLGRLGLDVVDAQHIADRMNPTHSRIAGVAPFRLVVAMSGATLFANEDRCGRKAATFLGPNTWRQLGLVNAVGAPLVIDQAARAEFGNGDEASPLQICRLRAGAHRRHVGVERQPRKVVAGQEAFGRKIAVGVEVRTARCGAPFQQCELLVGLSLLNLGFLALPWTQSMHF